MKAPDQRDAAFIQPTETICGFNLRPFSSATLTVARELNVTIVFGSQEEISEEEKQRQLVTLLFIQAAPKDRVKQAVKVARKDRQEFLDEFLLPFEFELPIASLPKILAALEETFAQVSAADFETKGGGNKDPNF